MAAKKAAKKGKGRIPPQFLKFIKRKKPTTKKKAK